MTGRDLEPSTSPYDLARWAEWARLAARYRDLNLGGLELRGGFPVSLDSLEPEYYFARCEAPPEDPQDLLNSPAWHNLARLCARIGNGRLKLVKIRDGRPVAAKGEVSPRALQRLRSTLRPVPSDDFKRVSGEIPARPVVAGVRLEQEKFPARTL